MAAIVLPALRAATVLLQPAGAPVPAGEEPEPPAISGRLVYRYSHYSAQKLTELEQKTKTGKGGFFLGWDDLTLTAHVAFSPDGRLIACGTYDEGWTDERDPHKSDKYSLRIWEADSGQEKLRIRLPGNRGPFLSTCFAPDGRSVCACMDDTVYAWSATSGKLLWSGGHPGVISVSFLADGKRLTSAGGFDSGPWSRKQWTAATTRIWDASTGRELARCEVLGKVRQVTVLKETQNASVCLSWTVWSGSGAAGSGCCCATMTMPWERSSMWPVAPGRSFLLTARPWPRSQTTTASTYGGHPPDSPD